MLRAVIVKNKQEIIVQCLEKNILHAVFLPITKKDFADFIRKFELAYELNEELIKEPAPKKFFDYWENANQRIVDKGKFRYRVNFKK